MRISWFLIIPTLIVVAVFPCLQVLAQGIPPPKTEETPPEEEVKDASSEIQIKNADIAVVVKIFSLKTKRNYILDERVKGKVSLYIPGKISADETLRILDAVLAYKGFTTVPIGENIWKIVPSKEAKGTTIPTRQGSIEKHPSPSVVTRLVQLKYVTADEVRQFVSQLISSDGFVSAYSGTNSMIIIDAEDNIERLMQIINSLDVPFSGQEMTIVPIKHADAVDIADKLNQILGEGSGDKDSTGDPTLDFFRARVRHIEAANSAMGRSLIQGSTTGATPPSTSSLTASGTNTITNGTPARSRQPKIIADERTNSIIIVADEDTTARIQALISQLDSKVDLSGTRFYVYRCQHASAEDLSEVLSGLVGGGSTNTSGTRQSSTGGLLGGGEGDDFTSSFGGSSRQSRNKSSGSRSTQNRLQGQQRTPGRSRSEGSNSGGQKTAFLGENISITADPSTNSLVILANKTDYQKILILLQDLDIKRRQVLVEAMLLEVGLDNQDTSATSFLTSTGGADGAILAQNNLSNITGLLSDPNAIQNFSIAAASAGTLTIGGGESAITLPTQTVLLNAAKRNSNVNVLSAPTILTTDNEQAEIVVGQNVPFLASTATDVANLSNTFNQIDRQDVGITLRLTPQISSGDMVTLQIFTEVSNVTTVDPRLGPTTSIRTSETSVITKDAQMIVIGGLMSDNVNESDTGVPYLMDIPVLGYLFKTSVQEQRRTNLLILITPRIIKDQYDARDESLVKRDMFETEVRERDLYPNREEVLHSEDFDKVSEMSNYDGALPSTILGSEKTSPNQASNQVSPEQSNNRNDSGTLELNINPPLPSSIRSKTNEDVRDLRGSYNYKDDIKNKSSPTTERYLIMKIQSGALDHTSLPFSASKEENLVGIVLPADAPSQVLDFFKAGNSYSYSFEETKSLSLSLETILNTPQDAYQLFPSLSSEREFRWHTLSPYEIMSLGEGPWLRMVK